MEIGFELWMHMQNCRHDTSLGYCTSCAYYKSSNAACAFMHLIQYRRLHVYVKIFKIMLRVYAYIQRRYIGYYTGQMFSQQIIN